MYRRIFLALLALVISALPASAQYYDYDWLSVRGTVQSIDDNSFVLDYGEGTVDVELETGWDWFGNDNQVIRGLVGEQVTVTGQMDNDLFANAELEADSVYLHSTGTYYWTSADTANRYYADPIQEDNIVVLEGVVSSVSDDEFTLRSAPTPMIVETEELGRELNLQVGDRVRVRGESDWDIFEGRELEADDVVIMR